MTTPATAPEHRRSRRLFATVIVLAAVASLAVTALLINIFERKQEAKNPFYRVVELNDTIDDPATWAKNFPLQYDLYMRTVDMQRTKYGWKRGHAALANPGRSALRGGAFETSGRPATEDHLGRLFVFGRLPRAPRSRLHAGRSDFHCAPEVQSAGHVHQLPCVPSYYLSETWRTSPPPVFPSTRWPSSPRA